MLTEVTEVVAQVAMHVFVVGSMAAMGLGLVASRIVAAVQPVADPVA